MRQHPGLVIRREQIQAFQPRAEEVFVTRTMEYLRENHAEVIAQLPAGAMAISHLPEETLREMVRNGIVRARRHGMSWKSTLKAFVVLMFIVAPNFDEHPLIKHILEDEKIEANLRLDQLWERTTEENWIAAKQYYDAGAWHQEFPEDEQ
jgi:hypothetical protein